MEIITTDTNKGKNSPDAARLCILKKVQTSTYLKIRGIDTVAKVQRRADREKQEFVMQQ